MVAFQSAQIIFFAGEENDLVAGGTFLNQLTGLCSAVCIHIRKRIVKDDNTASVGKKMVKSSVKFKLLLTVFNF